MRKKRINKGNNTKVAIIFVGFVVSVVLISLIFKFAVLLSQSQYDSSKRFTISVSNGSNIEVLSFSPASPEGRQISHSISVLKLDPDIDESINQFLAIPIDGFVNGESLVLDQKIDSLFFKMILNYKNLQTNLTVIDFVRLFVFAKSLPERGIFVENISKDLSESEIDNIVGRLVSDKQIEKDGKTIQIINGTNVSGLGNRLARLIANIGGDVIIVATANRTEKQSEISYIDDKNYTAELLSEILGFRIVKVSEKKIADITITIGEDSLKSLSF